MYYTWEDMDNYYQAERRYLELAIADYEAALPVLKSWDGKVVNKRLQTAIQKVAPNIDVRNRPYSGEACLHHFDYDARMYPDGRLTGYVNDWVHDGPNLGCRYNERLVYDVAEQDVLKTVKRYRDNIAQYQRFASDPERFVREYNEAAKAIRGVRDAIGYDLAVKLGMTRESLSDIRVPVHR